MTKTVHFIYISSMVVAVLVISTYLFVIGQSYYSLPLEERFYHPRYDWFKPAGTIGHGLGIAGTVMILFGVTIYILRKRYNIFARFIRLKYLLEFHIFLCTLGPILIVFHTTFKFGGIVSIAFWSMVAVVLSGVIGRFIYIQIPRTIEGRMLGLKEVHERREELSLALSRDSRISEQTHELIKNVGSFKPLSISGFIQRKLIFRRIKNQLDRINTPSADRGQIMSTIQEEIALSQRLGRLQTMQNLFKYWHVVHLPFALIMLIIVVIHVIVTLALGYKWIF
jgi:hypothetical protein